MTNNQKLIDDLEDAQQAHEILSPNIENEMRGAEGSEAEEIGMLWIKISNALFDAKETLVSTLPPVVDSKEQEVGDYIDSLSRGDFEMTKGQHRIGKSGQHGTLIFLGDSIGGVSDEKHSKYTSSEHTHLSDAGDKIVTGGLYDFIESHPELFQENVDDNGLLPCRCGGKGEIVEKSDGYIIECNLCSNKSAWGDYGYQAKNSWNAQPQAVAGGDVIRLRKALSEATSILECAGYLVQAAEYKEILEDTE